jgi:hypothetical protein
MTLHWSYLDKEMNRFQVNKLVVCDVYTEDKIQPRVSSIYQFISLILHERGQTTLLFLLQNTSVEFSISQ